VQSYFLHPCVGRQKTKQNKTKLIKESVNGRQRSAVRKKWRIREIYRTQEINAVIEEEER
jgi:hypothetical protein